MSSNQDSRADVEFIPLNANDLQPIAAPEEIKLPAIVDIVRFCSAIKKAQTVDDILTRLWSKSIGITKETLNNPGFLKQLTGKFNGSGLPNNEITVEDIKALAPTASELAAYRAAEFPNFPGHILDNADAIRERSLGKPVDSTLTVENNAKPTVGLTPKEIAIWEGHLRDVARRDEDEAINKLQKATNFTNALNAAASRANQKKQALAKRREEMRQHDIELGQIQKARARLRRELGFDRPNPVYPFPERPVFNKSALQSAVEHATPEFGQLVADDEAEKFPPTRRQRIAQSRLQSAVDFHNDLVKADLKSKERTAIYDKFIKDYPEFINLVNSYNNLNERLNTLENKTRFTDVYSNDFTNLSAGLKQIETAPPQSKEEANNLMADLGITIEYLEQELLRAEQLDLVIAAIKENQDVKTTLWSAKQPLTLEDFNSAAYTKENEYSEFGEYAVSVMLKSKLRPSLVKKLLPTEEEWISAGTGRPLKTKTKARKIARGYKKTKTYESYDETHAPFETHGSNEDDPSINSVTYQDGTPLKLKHSVGTALDHAKGKAAQALEWAKFIASGKRKKIDAIANLPRTSKDQFGLASPTDVPNKPESDKELEKRLKDSKDWEKSWDTTNEHLQTPTKPADIDVAFNQLTTEQQKRRELGQVLATQLDNLINLYKLYKFDRETFRSEVVQAANAKPPRVVALNRDLQNPAEAVQSNDPYEVHKDINAPALGFKQGPKALEYLQTILGDEYNDFISALPDWGEYGLPLKGHLYDQTEPDSKPNKRAPRKKLTPKK